jgi:FkbM family methyltransferase
MAADLRSSTPRSDNGGLSVMLHPRDETRLVQAFFQSQRGYFVDVGANDPTDWSQTFHLEQLGWDGVLVEPQPDLAETLRRSRKAIVYAVACSSPENSGRSMPLKLAGAYSTLNPALRVAHADVAGSIDVPIKTLDEVLTEAQAPSPIDFLSIDVEGHEREVLRLHNDLVARGYAWIRRTGLNSWYVPAASVPAIGPYGHWQFLRKYYLGVPIRRLREVWRRFRQRI